MSIAHPADVRHTPSTAVALAVPVTARGEDVLVDDATEHFRPIYIPRKLTVATC